MPPKNVSTDSVWTPSTSITRHRRIPRPTMSISSVLLSLFFGNIFLANFAAAAISVAYCSPDNTGAKYPAYNYNWQSNGECYDHCVGDYAFGIILGKNCWCSNIIPDDLKDLEDCSDPCPGYPDDKCGNERRRYYNYIELPGQIPTPKSDLSTTSRSSETSTAPPMETTDPPNTPIISVTTILGSQMTITVTPANTGGPNSSSFPVNSGGGNDFFSDAGRAAGVFVGIFVGIAILAALIFFFIRKRRKDRRKSVGSSHHNPEMGMSGNTSPQLGTGSASPNNRPRSTSTLGLVGGLSQDKSATVTTTGFTETDRVTDQRLDPNQIWMRFDNDNSSRVSLRSLQDNQDYSRRVLKLTNPDA